MHDIGASLPHSEAEPAAEPARVEPDGSDMARPPTSAYRRRLEALQWELEGVADALLGAALTPGVVSLASAGPAAAPRLSPVGGNVAAVEAAAVAAQTSLVSLVAHVLLASM